MNYAEAKAAIKEIAGDEEMMMLYYEQTFCGTSRIKCRASIVGVVTSGEYPTWDGVIGSLRMKTDTGLISQAPE